MRDAIKLCYRLVLLLGINAALGWGVLWLHEMTLPEYEPWETDSRLLLMPEDARVGAAFLGTSHAYLFSRFKENHAITEAAVGRSVFNMALPTGGGLRPARFYFEAFLARGNRCDVLVYFLDPFVFYAAGPNDNHKFVWFEPFRIPFFIRMLRDGYPRAQLIDYGRSKFGPDWLFQQRETLIAHPGTLTPEDVDPQRIQMRFDSLYYQGVDVAAFRHYRQEFSRIAQRCDAEGIPLLVIIPPTLLGPEPGAQRVLEWLEEERARHPFVLRNLVDAVPDPRYYYNLDHLNTEGVRHFMEHFAAPEINRMRKAPGRAIPAPRG